MPNRIIHFLWAVTDQRLTVRFTSADGLIAVKYFTLTIAPVQAETLTLGIVNRRAHGAPFGYFHVLRFATTSDNGMLKDFLSVRPSTRVVRSCAEIQRSCPGGVCLRVNITVQSRCLTAEEGIAHGYSVGWDIKARVPSGAFLNSCHNHDLRGIADPAKDVTRKMPSAPLFYFAPASGDSFSCANSPFDIDKRRSVCSESSAKLPNPRGVAFRNTARARKVWPGVVESTSQRSEK